MDLLLQVLTKNDIKEGLVRVTKSNLDFFQNEKNDLNSSGLMFTLPDGKSCESEIEYNSKSGLPRFIKEIRSPLKVFYKQVSAKVDDKIQIEKNSHGEFTIQYLSTEKDLAIEALPHSITSPFGSKPLQSNQAELPLPTTDSESIIAKNDGEDSGVGYESDPKIRKAIENYAVAKARAYYEKLQYTVTEKGKPYDLLCTKSDEILHVEVKGSRTTLDAIIVTTNEVKDARDPAWKTQLFLVDKIRLASDGDTFIASEGRCRHAIDWFPEENDLTPIQYRYKLPSLSTVD